MWSSFDSRVTTAWHTTTRDRQRCRGEDSHVERQRRERVVGLEETTPAIVCLHQLKAPQDKRPEAAIRETGYGAIWNGQKSWKGVAILAR
jgi:exonuclease III